MKNKNRNRGFYSKKSEPEDSGYCSEVNLFINFTFRSQFYKILHLDH